MRHNRLGFLNHGQTAMLASIIASFMDKFLRLAAPQAAGRSTKETSSNRKPNGSTILHSL